MTDKTRLKRPHADGRDVDMNRFPLEGEFIKLSSSSEYVKNISTDQPTECKRIDNNCGLSANNYCQFQMNTSDMDASYMKHIRGQFEQTSVPEHSVCNTVHNFGAQPKQVSSTINSQMSPLQLIKQQNTLSIIPSNPQQTQVMPTSNCQMPFQSGIPSTHYTLVSPTSNCHMPFQSDIPSTHHTHFSTFNSDNCLPVQMRSNLQYPLSLSSVSPSIQCSTLVSSSNINQTLPVPIGVKKEHQCYGNAGSYGHGLNRVRQTGPENMKLTGPENVKLTDGLSTTSSSAVRPLLDNLVDSKSHHGWQNLNTINVYSGMTHRKSNLPISFQSVKTEKSDVDSQTHVKRKLITQYLQYPYQDIKQARGDTIYSQEAVTNQTPKHLMPVQLIKQEQTELPVTQAGTYSHLTSSHSLVQLMTTNTSGCASDSILEQNSKEETRSLHETCMSLQRGIFKFIPCLDPLSIADAYLQVEKEQCEELGQIPTPKLAVYAYNPLEYAFDVHFKFVQRFCNSEKEILFLGMNPGPWGMSQNGVPFGEAKVVRDWMQLSGNVLKPDPEHPKRQVTGLECTRSEVSGSRFWSLFQGLCGTPENFFLKCFVYNMCPLSFMSVTGKNITPPQIEAQIRKEINSICDRALLKVVKLLKVRTIVAVGKYAYDRAHRILKRAGDGTVRLETMMHPSPINPAANQGWEQKVKCQLRELNLLDIIGGGNIKIDITHDIAGGNMKIHMPHDIIGGQGLEFIDKQESSEDDIFPINPILPHESSSLIGPCNHQQ